jgi:hypothetical protein
MLCGLRGGGCGGGVSLSALNSSEGNLRYLPVLTEVIQSMLSCAINVPCYHSRPSPA